MKITNSFKSVCKAAKADGYELIFVTKGAAKYAYFFDVVRIDDILKAPIDSYMSENEKGYIMNNTTRERYIGSAKYIKYLDAFRKYAV